VVKKRYRGRDRKPRKLPAHTFKKGNTSGIETRFTPGQSPNPGGRAKSALLSEAYRRKLADLVPNDPKGRTFSELIADAMVNEAIKGKVHAASEINDRTEGKPRQEVEVNTPGIAIDIKYNSLAELAAEIVKERNANSG